jgi:hypothetical protein
MDSLSAAVVAVGTTEPNSPTLRTRNDKRERKHTAQTLPSGITQSMMKKYVVYYREFVNLKNGKRVPREYFKVESHPRLARPWVSSKSGKISLHEKLEAANQVVTDLETNEGDDVSAIDDNGMTSPQDTAMRNITHKYLPKYTNIRIVKQDVSSYVYSLVYDQKDNQNGFRWTCSHVFRLPVTPECPKPVITDALISLELQNLKRKLYDKYMVELFEIPPTIHAEVFASPHIMNE